MYGYRVSSDESSLYPVVYLVSFEFLLVNSNTVAYAAYQYFNTTRDVQVIPFVFFGTAFQRYPLTKHTCIILKPQIHPKIQKTSL